MKFISHKSDISEGIAIVINASTSKTSNPFLEGILIEAGEVLKFTCFNNEIGIETIIPADILEKGSLVINSKLFSDIIRALPESEVSVVAGKNYEVHIEAEESKYDIRGLNADGFPPLPGIESGMSFKIKQSLFKDMIKKTVFAVGVEQHRVILTGLLIDCKDNEINVVGIDGFRVAWRKEHTDIKNEEIQVVVPGKTMNELSRILFQTDDMISAVLSSKYILFQTEKTKFLSRILEGNYLAYKSLIPDNFSTVITANTKSLLESVDGAVVLSSSESNMYLSLSTKGDLMNINSNSDYGNYNKQLRVIQEGSDIEIIFNPKYLLDALKAVQDEENIKIGFNSNIHPCVIMPEEGDNFIYMILPLRV